jgi:hypothetical protein
LARKAGCTNPCIGNRLELADVGGEWNLGEVSPQDALRRGVDLTEKLCSVSGVVETDLDATNACEQADDGKLLLPLRRRSWMRYAEGHGMILWSSDDVANICSTAYSLLRTKRGVYAARNENLVNARRPPRTSRATLATVVRGSVLHSR